MVGGDDDGVWAPSAPPSSPAPVPAATPAGVSLLAGYRDFVKVAQGGDSIVYRAHQDALDRDVAVKVVLLDDPESIARFRRELTITVRLGRQHPNIMTVLDTGTTTEGQPCLVMDYVELGSLHNRLVVHGPLPVSEVVAAASVVADALAFAHEQGVLHRDVKPQNVLVLPTSYVLADFGLARAIDAEHSASLERFSYRHASPQILDGEAPAIADDVYSLGSTIFTLLDGRAPFAADDPNEDSALSYLRRARTEAPRNLDRTDVPERLAGIIARCLAKRRADRFAGAAELRAALATVPTEADNWAPGADPASGPRRRHDPTSLVTVELPATAAADTHTESTRRAEPTPAAPGAAPPRHAQPSPVTEAAPVEPVAVSALAHLTAPSSGRDDAEATGTRPPEFEPDPSGRSNGANPDAANQNGAIDRPGRGRRYVLAGVCVLALAAGILIGYLRGGHATTSAAGNNPTTSTGPSTASTQAVIAVGPVDPNNNGPTASAVFDPKLAPKVTRLQRKGDSRVVLSWTDPSRGKFPFVVLLDDDHGRRVLGSPQRGVTSVTLTDFPDGKQCVRVASVSVDATGDAVYGVSDRRCTSS